MFATIYIYVLLFEFQNMFATMYGCSSFDELLRSKVKNGKKVKKHYDHIRTASIKKLNWPGQNLSEKPNRSIPVPISNGGERRCRNEIRSMTSLILFFSFSVRIPPMVVTIRTPRVHSKALRRSPADSH